MPRKRVVIIDVGGHAREVAEIIQRMALGSAFASAGSSVSDHADVNVGATVSHDMRPGSDATRSPSVRLTGNLAVGEEAATAIAVQRADVK